MAFDQTTRNRLARFVSDARALLTEEFTRQLQNEYGLDPASGDVTPIDRLTALDDRQRETARILRETLDYYLAGNTHLDGKTYRDVLDRIVREQAFTVLNRLCAFRMSEARGLVLESIAKGYQSKGFQLYARLAGSALGETGETYNNYLLSLMDEFAVDLPVLFDRFSPQGRLFPREAALLKLLGLINNPEIDPLWTEDETIGWIYQYFNSKEERKAMRDASQAPRNSRELAVRNQFFTPRYVVEFLTDNTLGRIWYEMTKGETALKDTCRYLVRRPNEIFLNEGEAVPEQIKTSENLSQEELLRQPVYIPHRPLKDPREIKMLDPACGSMHFGLYAFDLFEQIYAEAWELEERLGEDALQRLAYLEPLHVTYPNKEAYLRDVSRLIIECNIHGVDIDPRAVQIAGLSLWLRAQKSWQALGLHPSERPQIHRSNVVCAEPMPGDRQMLEEFLTTLRGEGLEALMRKAWHVPADQKVRATMQMADALAKLVRTVWQEMELTGEAGSLLKTEETLRNAIDIARMESVEKSPLFRVLEYGLDEPSKEQYMQLVNGRDQDFFDNVEWLVLCALNSYSSELEGNGGYRRRLFADDAGRGFTFLALIQKKYDVLLMNPPFGNFPLLIKNYSLENYTECKDDIDAAFVSRAINLLKENGKLGVIANRTELFKSSLNTWRKSTLLSNNIIQVLVDLGQGVLDDALVEAACYVLEKNGPNTPSLFFRLLKSVDRDISLLRECCDLNSAQPSENSYCLFTSVFCNFPDYRIPYWASHTVINAFNHFNSLGSVAKIKQGLASADDFRFLRLAWEIPSQGKENGVSYDNGWIPFAKGGEYSPYFADIHLVVNWKNSGKELKNRVNPQTGRTFSNVAYLYETEQNYFQKPGLTWSVRTASGFSPRILPQNCIFSHTGDIIWTESNKKNSALLSILMSRISAYMIEMMVASGDAVTSGTAARSYEVGIIRNLPIPPLTDEFIDGASSIVHEIWTRLCDIDSESEVSRYFIGPKFFLSIVPSNFTLQSVINENFERTEDQLIEILEKTHELENSIQLLFGLDNSSLKEIESEFGPHPCKLPRTPISESQYPNFQNYYTQPIDKAIYSLVDKSGGSRSITKKAYYVDRRIELLSTMFDCHPSEIINARRRLLGVPIEYCRNKVFELISFSVGVGFNRWITNPKEKSNSNRDPYTAFPVFPPIEKRESLRNSGEMIFVNDAGNRNDITSYIINYFQDRWPNENERIEQEICEFLGVRSLQEYINNPLGFFEDHLRVYSKSRRAAPIYWPLSTPSCTYTLWLYYHRLNDQTLYTCVNDFVDPKLKQVSDESARLRLKKGRSANDEKELERLTDFERELKDFREELLRVAKFWKPNLNDGVEITAAPLWKLFQHKPWQKRLKETWQKLEAGEYDWAHLAYSIWLERVREKCKNDKSLAIAHDLEELYVEPPASAKKKKAKKPAVDEETEGWFNDD